MGLEGVGAELRKIDDAADRLMKAVVIETLKRLVLKTPVDTGRARANWGLHRALVEATADEEAKDPTGQATINIGFQDAKRFRVGDTVYIVNGLDYIPALEDGHSGQAPQGMVKVTVKEIETHFPEIVRRVRNESR